MEESTTPSETVEVPRSVLVSLLSKVESLETKLRPSEREGPGAPP